MAENTKVPTITIEVVDCPIQYKGQILAIGKIYEVEALKAKELIKIGVAKLTKGK